MAPDSRYYTFIESPVQTHSSSKARITITRYLSESIKDNPQLGDMESILLAIQMACKTISNLVHRAGLAYSIERQKVSNEDNDFSDGRFYS